MKTPSSPLLCWKRICLAIMYLLLKSSVLLCLLPWANQQETPWPYYCLVTKVISVGKLTPWTVLLTARCPATGACIIAPSLWLFVPNNLIGSIPIPSFIRCLFSAFLHGSIHPTVTALHPFVPRGSLIMCHLVQCGIFFPFFIFMCGGETSECRRCLNV
jgi:hypothetical protein